MNARIHTYLLSLPERVLRSASALAGGLVREVGEAALPAAIRRTKLYQGLVEASLRFLIEQLGQVEGVYPAEGRLPSDFLLRRTTGNLVEAAGILAFRASPVWVLAALADLSGAGRHLIAEIAASLQQEGLLEPGATFQSVDEMLDGFERTAARLAEAINTPPLDVQGLRREWSAIRAQARRIPPRRLPSAGLVRRNWEELRGEAAAQGRSVFELSSLMALSAARKTRQVFSAALLDHYADTLTEIRRAGFLSYWAAELGPYLAAAARHLSPQPPRKE